MRENDQLKIALNEHERAGIQMKSVWQQRDAQMESDNERLRGVLEKERATSRKLEESLRVKIEQLQAELRGAQSRMSEIEHAQPLQRSSYDNRQPPDNKRFETIVSPPRTFHQEEQPMRKQNNNWLGKEEYSQQSVVPQAMQRKVPNQNVSSLNDVLAWENNQSKGQFKSLERNVQQSYFVQGRPNTQADNQRSKPLQQPYSPRNNASNNSFNSDDNRPPAGKRSDIVTHGSGESHQKQLTHLQNSLSALQMDKERMENEYRKLGTSKNKQQIERKKELEFEVEVVNKGIH